MKRILTLLLTLVLILGLIPASSVSAAAPTVTEPALVADAAIVLKENWYTLSDKYNRGEEEKWYHGFPGKGDRVSLPHASSASATSVWYYNKFTPDLNLTDGQQETVESASAFIEEKGYTFPVFYDTDIDAAMKYGVSAVPVSYFIDAEGYFVAWAQGALSADMLQQGMDLLLG